MLVLFEKSMMFPMMVNLSTWFEEWPPFGGGSGSITPEEIPSGVLWASLDRVIIRDEAGTYILRNPDGD